MIDGAKAVPESARPRDGIPLDLGSVLAPYAQHRHLSLRVGQLPALARFSRGKRNDDRTWSLTPSDLANLELLLAEGSEPPPSLTIDIVGIDESDNAAVIGQVEVPVVPASFAVKAQVTAETTPPGPWRRRMERRVQAALRLSGRRADTAMANAETEWRAHSEARLSAQVQELDAAWQDRVQAERRAREAAELKTEEAAEELTALSLRLETALAQAAANKAATDEAAETRRVEDFQEQLVVARAEWEKDSEARVAAAVKQSVMDSEDEAELRFRVAEARWREVTDREVEAARQQAAPAVSPARDFDAELAASRSAWQAENEAELRAQVLRLEQAWQEKIAVEQSRRQAAEADVEATKARCDDDLQRDRAATEARLEAEAQERLAAVRTEWERDSAATEARLEAEAQERLAAARTEWERDRAAIEARLEAEAQERLAAVRTEWERDSAARIATAVKQAVADSEVVAEVRVREAEARWREATDRDIEAARRACAEAENTARQLEQKHAIAHDAWQAESAARLSEQGRELELAWRERLDTERQSREEAESRAQSAARERADLTVRLEAAASSHADALQQETCRAEARLAQELQAQIAAARAEWVQDSEAQTAATVAQAVADCESAAETRFEKARVTWQEQARREREDLQATFAAQQAAAAEASRDAETHRAAGADSPAAAAAQSLEQTRAQWEEEAQERTARQVEAALAEAEGKWRAEEAGRLTAARAAWKKKVETDPKITGGTARGLAEQQRKGRTWRSLARFALVAGGLGAGVVLYSEFKPAMVGEWQPKAVALISDIQSAALNKVQTLSDAAKPRMKVSARVANVRAGPSTTTAVVAKLPQDTAVKVLEQRGDWILIQFDAQETTQGWLHHTLLRATAKG